MRRIKVTSKGQITIPRALREKLQIKEGDYLDVSIYKNCLLLKPVPIESNKEIILEHCKIYKSTKDSLEKTRQILSKVPFSLSERVCKLREED